MAWTQPTQPGPSLSSLLIVAILSFSSVHSAPVTDQPGTELEYYPVADSTGCYYNFQHYDEGDRIITNEPCLNCTCHNRMLMCYLRVCPFTKAIGQDCKVEKKPDQCCPVITCPEVPVQLLTSTTTESSKGTEVGHLDAYGCSIDRLFYTDGARVPSHPNKPCELCYCIRNKTACVMQECTLDIEGCKPVYQEGVCCPVRYDCDHPEENLLETTVKPTPALIFTTTTMAPGPIDCIYNNELYADGALVKKDIPCEHCYCMKGDIVCAVQECGPTPLDKVNCTALPIREGQCCPDTYDCENIIEEDLTTISYEYTTTPTVQPIKAEEATTLYPAATTPESAVTTVKEEVQVTERIQQSSPSSEAAQEYTTTEGAEEVPSHDETAEKEEEEEETEKTAEEAATTTAKPLQKPFKEELPKKEDAGYVPEACAPEAGACAPQPITSAKPEVKQPETEQPEVVTQQPAAEAESEKIPAGEQVTELPTTKSAEEQTTAAATTAVPAVTGKEGEQEPAKAEPSEKDKIEPTIEKVTVQPEEHLKEKEQEPTEKPLAETSATTLAPKEIETSEQPLPETPAPTSAPEQEQYPTTEATQTTAKEQEEEKESSSVPAIAEQVTEKNVLPTIQPSELEKEGATVTEGKIVQTTESAVELTTLLEEAKTTAAQPPAEKERIPEREETQTPSVSETTSYVEQPATTEAGITSSVSEAEKKPEEAAVQEEQTTPSATKLPEQETEAAVTTSKPSVETTEQIKQKPEEEKPSVTTSKEEISTEQTTAAEVQATTVSQLPASTEKAENVPVTTEEVITELPYAPAHDEVAGEEGEEEEIEKEEGSGAHPPESPTEKPAAIEKSTEAAVEVTKELAGQTESTPESITQGIERSTEAPRLATTQPPFESTTTFEEKEAPVTQKESIAPEQVTELATAESVKPSTQVSPTEKMPSAEQETVPTSTEKQAEVTESVSEQEVISPEATTLPSAITTEQPAEKSEAPLETRIPGEGNCLVDGQTYTNNSVVPPINHCQTSCKCVSSILQCESVTCTAAPTNLQNCMPVYEGPDSCCPTYSCTAPGSPEMESDSHKLQTTLAPGTEQPTTVINEDENEIVPEQELTTIVPQEISKEYTTLPSQATTAVPEITVPVKEVTEVSEALTPKLEEKVSATVKPTEYPELPTATESQTQKPEEQPQTTASYVYSTTERQESAETVTLSREFTTQPAAPSVGIAETESSVTAKPVEPVVVEENEITDEDTQRPSERPEQKTTPEEIVTVAVEIQTAPPEIVTERGTEQPEVTTSQPALTEATYKPEQPADVSITKLPESVPTEKSTPAFEDKFGTTIKPTEAIEVATTEIPSVTEKATAYPETTRASQEITTEGAKEAEATTKLPESQTAEVVTEGVPSSEKPYLATVIPQEASASTEEARKPEESVTEPTKKPEISTVREEEGVASTTPAISEIEHVTEKRPSEEIGVPESHITEIPLPTTSKAAKEEEVVTTEAAPIAEEETVKPSLQYIPVEVQPIPERSTSIPLEPPALSNVSTEAAAATTGLPRVETETAAPEIIQTTTAGEKQTSAKATEESATSVPEVTTQAVTEPEKYPEEERLPAHDVAEEPAEVETEKPTESVVEGAATTALPEGTAAAVTEGIPQATEAETAKPLEEEIPSVTQRLPEIEKQTTLSPEPEISTVPSVSEEQQTTISGETTGRPVAPSEAETEKEPAVVPTVAVEIAQTTQAVTEQEERVTEKPSEPEILPVSTTETAEAATEEVVTSKPEVSVETEAPQAEFTTAQPEAATITSAPEAAQTTAQEQEVATTAQPAEASKEVTSAEPQTTRLSEIVTGIEQASTTESEIAVTERVKPQIEENITSSSIRPVEAPEIATEQAETAGPQNVTVQEGLTTEVPEVTTAGLQESSSKAQEETEKPLEPTATPALSQETTAQPIRPTIPGEGQVQEEERQTEKAEAPTTQAVEVETEITTVKYEFTTEGRINATDRVSELFTSGPPEPTVAENGTFTSAPVSALSTTAATTEAASTTQSSSQEPETPEVPDYHLPTTGDDYDEEDQGSFGPGTCRYGGKVYVSAQQIPRDDPCDFCFCFRSDIICLQQSCPPPIPRCHEEPIRGFCCPRYECPVSMATSLNITTTSTTTTTTLPPHFLSHAYKGRATKEGCQIQGQAYRVGEVVRSASGPCLHCTCGGDGQMKCDPKACSPEPMLRQMMEAATSRRRR